MPKAKVTLSDADGTTLLRDIRGNGRGLFNILNQINSRIQPHTSLREFSQLVGTYNSVRLQLNNSGDDAWFHYSRRIKMLIEHGANTFKHAVPSQPFARYGTDIDPRAKADEGVSVNPVTADQQRVPMVEEKDEPNLSSDKTHNEERKEVVNEEPVPTPTVSKPNEQIYAKTFTPSVIPDVVTIPSETDREIAKPSRPELPIPIVPANATGNPHMGELRQTKIVDNADLQFDARFNNKPTINNSGQKALQGDGHGNATLAGAGRLGEDNTPGMIDGNENPNQYTNVTTTSSAYQAQPIQVSKVGKTSFKTSIVTPQNASETTEDRINQQLDAPSSSTNVSGSDIIIPTPTSKLRPYETSDHLLGDLKSRGRSNDGVSIDNTLLRDRQIINIQSERAKAAHELVRLDPSWSEWNPATQGGRSLYYPTKESNNFLNNTLQLRHKFPILGGMQDFIDERIQPSVLECYNRGW